ncbi:MAG: sulfatase-like hydrolase/transferase, partial [Myxococcales bacterium]|nr:sulfatase-like hydrolase/transferase [Myxococcales bacterium]
MAPRSTLRARDLPPLLARFLGAGALVSASVCALDVLLGGGGPLALLHALGLGVTLGAGLGLALGLPVLLLSLAGVRLLRLASLLGGGVLGFLWASSFGAVDRLFGAYARMAIVVVIGCVLGWMCFGFFLGLTPPRSRGGRFGEGAARRSVLLALFIAAALAVSIIDRFGPSMSVYPVARRGLELLGLGSMLLAWLWIARPVPARLRRFGLIAALIVAPLPLLSLPATPSVALHPLATRPFTALALAMLRETIDLDGDGYSGVLGGGDCAPLDPARHPSARDRPGNGVDEDCIGGDLAPEPQAPIPSPASAPASPSPSSLVLITVDSLRPDFLGAYGHRAGTTPRLDAWAEGAVRFERAYTSAGWTSMALSSLFRGLYPRHLRWQLVFETAGYRLLLEGAPPLQEGERINHGFLLPIGDPHPTLPDLLAARGMQTAAVVDDGETDFLSPEAGIFGSFEHLETLDALPPERRDDARVADRAIARLEALSE